MCIMVKNEKEKINEFALSIRVLRRKFGYTMGQLSREMELESVSEYSKLETGRYNLQKTESMFERAFFAIVLLYYKDNLDGK